MKPPQTGLRHSYRRARALPFDGQLQECVDQLQHPELMAAELEGAHGEMREWLRRNRAPASSSDPRRGERRGFFYGSRDIFVVRDSSSFTCLAADFEPLPEPPRANPESPGGALACPCSEGLDYVAITCTASPRPVLGVVQSEIDTSAYPLLLRLFACLCELAHEPQLVRLDREVLRGVAGPLPGFDLHLVLWNDWVDENEVPERTPISQLTRDLAETCKAALAAHRQFPPVLRDIVCLYMNPKRFDGRVRFDWRV